MSIDTYKALREVWYDKEGNVVDEESPLAYESRQVVDCMGEEVELELLIGVDWKESPLEVMDQVNAALEQLGVEVRFHHVEFGDDSYAFGVEPLR